MIGHFTNLSQYCSDKEVTGMFSYNLLCSLPPADLHDGYHL